MHFFHLQRNEDESGVSGTGKVAQGAIFDNGKASMTFLQDKTSVDAESVAVYDSIEDVKKIHGHDGKTKVMIESHKEPGAAYELEEWKQRVEKQEESITTSDEE